MPENEEAAKVMSRWLDDLKAANEPAFAVIDDYFLEAGPKALGALTRALGVQFTPGKDPYFGKGALAFLEAAAGDTANKAAGQVVIESVWADPPVPEDGKAFAIVWEETNVSNGATGPYQAAVQIRDVEVIVELASLDGGAKVQRRAEFPRGIRAGEVTAIVYSPWYGSPGSTLTGQAGRTTSNLVDLTIGADAAANMEKQRQISEIQSAVTDAQRHISSLSYGSDFDLEPINLALRALIKVAPTLDQELDLEGKAMQVLARNPATVGPDDRAKIVAKAKDAIVALTTAGARVSVDDANPVDHPDVVASAKLLVELADLAIEAPVAEAPQ